MALTDDHDTRPRGWSPDEVTADAPGVDELNVATWPQLLRERLRGRFSDRPKPSNRWAVLAIVLVGLFTVSVSITLLAVSLVDIANDLGSTESFVAWTVTAPMLAFGLVGPAAGKAGDLWGHKRLFCLGLLGAAVFALATAFSPNAAALVVFRTLSATFGSFTGPSALAIINRQFDADERVRALGFWSLTTAGAPVLGVVLGGPLVEAVGWRAIFLVQAPLLLVGLLVALAMLPETERGERSQFDWQGALLLALGVTSLLIGVNRGSAWGWTSVGVLTCFVLSPLALALFVVVERQASEPLLPLSWVTRRNLAGPIANQALSNFAYMGGFILTPILLEKGLGYSTAFVGLLIICRPLAFSITAPTAGLLTVRVGERVAGVAGAAIVAGSMVALAAIGEGTSTVFIGFALALSGIGLGFSSPAMGATVANAVDEADLGVAGALQQLMAQVGSVVGVQVMQTVQVASESRGYVASFANAYYVGAGVALLGMLSAMVIRPTPRVAPVRT